MSRTAKNRPRRSVARQLLVWQVAVVVVLVALGSVLAAVDERRDSDDAARREVIAIAVSLARATSTRDAIASPNPTALLQPQTESIRRVDDVDFIVVMAPDRTRFTHTNTDLIGKPFSGNIDRALAGETFTETYEGSLGPSIRSVTPVFDGDRIIGLVSAGVTREKITDRFVSGLPVFLVVVLVALSTAVGASWLLSRRLRRQTLGMAPEELRAMYEHNEAVLHSIGEGLIVWSPGGRADVVNDEARRLLGLGPGPVTRADLPESLRHSRPDGIRDEMHLTDHRILVVNEDAVMWQGSHLGTVMTLRDRTELHRVGGELDSMTTFAESLRSQAHESANRLHTVITLVELGQPEEAMKFATRELALSQHLIDRMTSTVQEPAVAALLLGKINQAAELGVELTVTEDTALTQNPQDGQNPQDTRELLTLAGNLIDNAIEASTGSDRPWVEVTIREEGPVLLVQVADSGPGMDPGALDAARRRGYSTKGPSRGLGLALVAQVLGRHGGTLTAENTYGSVVTATISRPVTVP